MVIIVYLYRLKIDRGMVHYVCDHYWWSFNRIVAHLVVGYRGPGWLNELGSWIT